MSDKNKTIENPIGAIVRKMESDYISGVTTISKYVQTSMYEDINKIDAYLNSKHTSGSTDSLGRDKPFFNIVIAARNIWYRATVIYLNKIKLRSTKSKDTIDAFLANIHLQEWFRKENYGIYLSEWGRTLASYGSAVSKYVEQDGELHCNVLPWNRLIVDTIDFDNNIKLEIIDLTEAQLRKRKQYDQKMIDKLCEARTTRKTTDGQQVDTKNDYIRLYEVHGELPLSYLTGNEKDEYEYLQQMQVVTFLASKEKGKFDDYCLYKGREKKDPNTIAHLIKEDGQTLSIGSVQSLFEAQWMMNHTTKSIKDQLDLASKLIFQTSDGSFVGQNALSAIETGDILIHKKDEPLTQLANSSHDITSLQNFSNQWKGLSNELVGISDSMLGNTAPSGTAWRQVEAILQQNQSLFELMRDNKGYYLKKDLREYVIPFIKKKMDTSEEVSTTLDQNDIDKIDAKYIKNESVRRTNKYIKEKALKGEIVTPEEQTSVTQGNAIQIKDSLAETGNQRFFKPSEISSKTWKEQFKDLEWELEIDTKDEEENSEALTTLNTMLLTIAKNPNILQDPNMKMIVNKILALTGDISPIELKDVPPMPSPIQPAPAQPVT